MRSRLIASRPGSGCGERGVRCGPRRTISEILFAFRIPSLVDANFAAPPATGTVAIAGLYMVARSHQLVIDDVTDPVLVDWGVYGLVRHPMYLGIQLCYLGVASSTASVASFLALGFVFLVYDRFAEFEEKELTEALGQQYKDYSVKVRRWVPRLSPWRTTPSTDP